MDPWSGGNMETVIYQLGKQSLKKESYPSCLDDEVERDFNTDIELSATSQGFEYNKPLEYVWHALPPCFLPIMETCREGPANQLAWFFWDLFPICPGQGNIICKCIIYAYIYIIMYTCKIIKCILNIMYHMFQNNMKFLSLQLVASCLLSLKNLACIGLTTQITW